MATRKTYNTIDCKQQLLLTEIKKGEYGGYKQDLLVDSLNEIEIDFYVCTKCNGIMRNACHIGEKQDPVCEMCKELGEVSIPMAKSRTNIPRLRVNCPLSSRGCVWKGSIGETDEHLDECIEFILPCSNLCGDILKRSELKNHCENECLNRKVNCIHCKIVFRYKEIDNHFTTCPELPLLCPNECMGTFLRKNINSHIEKDCPNMIIYCTNNCGVGMKRSESSAHYKDKCQLRIVRCKYCRARMQYKKLENHFNVCLEFPLICQNKCLKSLTRKEMNSHIEKDCPNTIVNCTNECGLKMKRSELSIHCENHCQFRIVNCEYCEVVMKYKKLENHYKVCLEYPLICPNECLKSLLRKEMNLHIEKDCPNTLVVCPYKEMGCKILSKRYELKQHEKLFESEHLKITKGYYLNVLQDKDGLINRLRTELISVKEENRRLKSSLSLFDSEENAKLLPKRKRGHIKIEYLYVHRSRSRAFSLQSHTFWKRCLVALEDGKLLFYDNEQEYRESGKSQVDTVLIRTWDRVCTFREVNNSQVPAIPYNANQEFGFAGDSYEQTCFFVANSLESAREWIELLEELIK